MEYELISVSEKDKLVYSLPIKIKDFDFLLKINDVKYPVFDDYNVKVFKDDKVICIDYWNNIALIDGVTGKLLLFTGLENSFVGIESLKHRYLVISDTALIMFAKEGFYPIYRVVLPDYIVDYKLINDKEIKLKFAVDNELVFSLE